MKNPLLYRSDSAGERSGGRERFLSWGVGGMNSSERRRRLALASSFDCSDRLE